MNSSILNKKSVNHPDVKIVVSLNKRIIGDQPQTKKMKTMGMAACQGLCIAYHLHSKAFCK